MNVEIKNKKFRHLMEVGGLKDVQLIKGDGYFYLVSDTDDDLGLALTSCPSIFICNFHDCTPEEWVELIRNHINNYI